MPHLSPSQKAERAARALSQPIPAPRAPRAKPQKSWAQLRPGQLLIDPDGLTWKVAETDSLGATLTAARGTRRLTDRAWREAGWRPRRRKAAPQEAPQS